MQTKMLNLHLLRKKIKNIKFNWLLFLLIGLFFIGLLLGSLSVKNGANLISDYVIKFYTSYLTDKSSFSLPMIFISSFFLSSTSVIISFFTGLCALGVPFIICVPFASGSIIGIISGFLYETYLLKGLGYCAIIIFPAAAITLVALILSCKESLLMSKNRVSVLATGRNQQQNRFRSYCIKHLIYGAVCAFAALIEAVLFNMFSNLFVF